MAIGEFSERSGLSAKRLRSYAGRGLLVPAAIDSLTGYRYYSPGQLHEARLIDTLRQAGMAIDDIEAFLRHGSLGRLDDWSRRVDSEASDRHKALDEARRLMGEAAAIPTTKPRQRRQLMTRLQ